MNLFFDTETTGLPRNWKAPITDLDNWPRMVQIAWILSDDNGNRIEAKDFIVKPEGYTIPRESSDIHRVTQEKAFREGVGLKDVLDEFEYRIDKSHTIIAHNISFDEKIVGAEFLRQRIRSNFSSRKKVCTMNSSTNYCRIPGPYGYKWPKLSELHFKLFDEDFEEAHDASVDISATERCFWKMKELGII